MTPRDDSTDARQPAAAEAGRRRFLGQGGRIAIPVAVTLAAQPALGVTCYSPSGSLSQNTTGGRSYTADCRGISSGNYKSQDTNWSGTGYAPTDPLSRMFPLGPYLDAFRSGNTTKSLREVMNLTNGQDPDKFAFHMIGAVLNCKNGLVPSNVMDEGVLRAIWQAVYTNGSYTVGGQPWNRARVVQYLKDFQIVG